MKSFSISLGKPFGIPVTIHWTFWLLILWIVFSSVGQEGTTGVDIAWNIGFVFTIFACVILHELGHALAARRFGVPTRSITILPIGGVAGLERIPEDPKQELVVAIAGPLVNVVIAGLLFLFLHTTGNWAMAMEDFTRVNGENFLLALFSVNVLLVLFNLIPAFPMDGGRMLRALLAFRMNRVKATEWAVNIGTVFAFLFVLWGFSGNPFLIFIALFIFLAARSELSQVKTDMALRDATVRDIIMHQYSILTPEDPLRKAVDILLDSQETRFLVTDADDRVVGLLHKDHILQGLARLGADAPIGQVMEREFTWLSPEMPLNEVAQYMMAKQHLLLPVGDGHRLEGVLDWENVNEYILIRNAQRDGHALAGRIGGMGEPVG